MKCPQCGNEQLVWDYIHGDVVCPKCGLVIDKIYDYSNNIIKENKENNYIKNDKKIIDYRYYMESQQVEIDRNYYTKRKSFLYLDIIYNNNMKKIFEKLVELGVLAGKKSKSRLIVTIYFSNEYKKYEKYLENIGISEKDYYKVLRKIPLKKRIHILAKIRESTE